MTLVLVLLFVVFQISTSEEKTVTLQNGLEGYTGCVDAHVTKTNWSSISDYQPTKNHGSEQLLRVHRESC